MGKISRRWDFLGCHFDGKYLTVAAKTVENTFYMTGSFLSN
jgi:hypothetical protein